MQPYQIVKARTREEALAQSIWRPQDKAVCEEIRAVGNSDGTFSLFATFGKPLADIIETPGKPRTCLDRP